MPATILPCHTCPHNVMTGTIHHTEGGRVDIWNKVNICGGGLPASSAFMFHWNFVDITHFNDLSKMFDVNVLTNNK